MGTVTAAVWISIAVLAVVASVVAVLPSKRQRLVGRMRSQAMQSGLKIQFISPAELKALQLEGRETGLIWYSYWGPPLNSAVTPSIQQDNEELEDSDTGGHEGDAHGLDSGVENETVEIVFKSESENLDALLDPQLYPSTEQLTAHQKALLRSLSSTMGQCLVALKISQNGVRCLWVESEQMHDVDWLAEQLKALVAGPCR